MFRRVCCARDRGRLCVRHHWIFRPKTESGERNHRWHWEQHLTPRLVASLTEEQVAHPTTRSKLCRPFSPSFSRCRRQKSVLMLGEQFEIDAVYGGEGKRRDAAPNKVVWGALDELPSPKL